jgi:hypothetical protein
MERDYHFILMPLISQRSQEKRLHDVSPEREPLIENDTIVTSYSSNISASLDSTKLYVVG